MAYDSEITTEDKVKLRLQQAKDRIIQRGWVVGELENENGYCILGALGAVEDEDYGYSIDQIGHAALERMGLYSLNAAYIWNDGPNSKDNVLFHIDRAIG